MHQFQKSVTGQPEDQEATIHDLLDAQSLP